MMAIKELEMLLSVFFFILSEFREFSAELLWFCVTCFYILYPCSQVRELKNRGNQNLVRLFISPFPYLFPSPPTYYTPSPSSIYKECVNRFGKEFKFLGSCFVYVWLCVYVWLMCVCVLVSVTIREKI